MATTERTRKNKGAAASSGRTSAGQSKANAAVLKRTSSKKKSSGNRYTTSDATRAMVWIRAAGHCELCGEDVSADLRAGNRMRWGQAAHILPASPGGPRAEKGHNAQQAARLSDDPDNLILACPGCHDRIDNDPAAYPKEVLDELRRAHREKIQIAAKTPMEGRAVPLILLSRHLRTPTDIPKGDLLRAMVAEGLWAIVEPQVIDLPERPSGGRNAAYWDAVVDMIQAAIAVNARRHSTYFGDKATIAVAGLADIPALMMLGQAIGDRSKRVVFSPNRETGLRWPDPKADPPEFRMSPLPPGDGAIALVLSLSAEVPERDVLKALPGARLVSLSVDHPSTSLVKNRRVIDAFREALQAPLSTLEAATADPIHVFAAVPAALAIEFGAFLTMQHRHPYVVYDRNDKGDFEVALRLGYHKESTP